MFVLDTNVVSEIYKSKADYADPRVIAWAHSCHHSSLFISMITILELEIGVLLMERRDPQQGLRLRTTMNNRIIPVFRGRVLPVDETIALRCAALHVPDPLSYRDSFIAATALVHGMTVVTRNVRDFESTGVQLLNPWQDGSGSV